MFSATTSSAVSVISCLTSLGSSGVPFSRAWEMTSPAAPDAWPVAADPVTAGIVMCAWPPYCVVPELRNQVPIGRFVTSGTP